MNGNPTAPPATGHQQGHGQQLAHGQPARPRRPPPKKAVGGPMRAPRKPLKNITRPLVSLQQMNETRKPADEPHAQVDSRKEILDLRDGFRQKGAHAVPLVVTRRDLRELRYHVMRLQNKTHVDVQDPSEFTPPIRLHRRDPRAPPSGAGSHFEEEETPEDLEEIKERERIEQQKEERRKIREENQAKIAPSAKPKPQAFQKKTEQKYRPDDTPEAKKRQLLRYEETLPWHLEDFENKQTWVGTYESELSEAHVMLSMDPNNPHNAITLAPMERWYRFNVKYKLKPSGDDDTERLISKIEQRGEEFLTPFEKRAIAREKEFRESQTRLGLSTRIGGGDDDEGRIRRRRDDGGIKREVDRDADDIDFDAEEEFADDEEGLNGVLEGEAEDVKEAEEKLKRDRQNAANFDRADEAELARQEAEEKAEEEERKALEKVVRKSLAKREKQYDYIDSDNENPYVTSSDSDTDSETERQRSKEEEEKKAAEANGKAPDGNIASGASSKGTNTPSGNHRTVDIRSKKRPGSPNLSEASGNESSRKKHKKKHASKSGLGSLKGAGSGSDSEMTDAGRIKKKDKKKKTLVLGTSPSGSPGASRAGSPVASQPNRSRASSPATPKPLPSAREVYDSIPKEGMAIQALINLFKARVDKSTTAVFIDLVKAISKYDKETKKVNPLPQMPSEEHIETLLAKKAQARAAQEAAAAAGKASS